MPKFLEDKLKAEASKKGFKGKRADRYVYGAMNNMGAMRGNQETAKGAYMDEEHRAKMAGDIRKFKGESAESSFRRPKRRVLRKHQ